VSDGNTKSELVWFVLVRNGTAETQHVLSTMALAGAIRTDLDDVYHLTSEILGTGSFATVTLAHTLPDMGRNQTSNDEPQNLAVKSFNDLSSAAASRAQQEAKALVLIGGHPNIVAFHGIFMTNSLHGTSWSLVFECCMEGDLDMLLRAERSLSRHRVQHLARGVLGALTHIHAQGFAHCDVKPSNVCIRGKDHILLADFGFATPILGQSDCVICWGTPGYMAPEILHKRPCTTAVDMFSLGAVLYRCASGEGLCKGYGPTSMLLANLTYDANNVRCLRGKLGSEGVDLIARLLRFNPSSRPSASEAYSHKALSLEEDDFDQVGEGLDLPDLSCKCHEDALANLGAEEVVDSDSQMLNTRLTSSRKKFVQRLVPRVLSGVFSGITKWRLRRGKNEIQPTELHFSRILPEERGIC